MIPRSIIALLVVVAITLTNTPPTSAQEAPDPSAWSFLEGTWNAEDSDGSKHVFTCKLNKEKNCYVLTSSGFHGTLGIDTSSDHPMLAVGYHPGNGYSVGHWKQESPTVVSGGFWMVDKDGNKKDYESTWEITKEGVVYSIDGEEYSRWRKKK